MRGALPLIPLLIFCVRPEPSPTVGPPSVLEAEPDGRLDAAVARGLVAAEAEAAGREERLPEARRAEVAHRLAEVRVVEQVDEVEREVERVALPFRAAGRAHHDHHRAAHAAHHGRAAAAAGARAAAAARRAAAAVVAAAVVTPLLSLLLLRGGELPPALGRAGQVAEGERAPDAEVDREEAGAFGVVARDDGLARLGVDVEVAPRRPHEVAVAAEPLARRAGT